MLSQNRREAKPVYSFPELRFAEISQCLEDLRIPVTEADLSKPSPLIVQRIYEAFAEIFLGNVAVLQRGPKEVLNGLQVAEMVEYPELHVDSVGLVTFYRSL
jgi:kinetochore protein Nuf2